MRNARSMIFRNQPNLWRIGSIESFKGLGSNGRFVCESGQHGSVAYQRGLTSIQTLIYTILCPISVLKRIIVDPHLIFQRLLYCVCVIIGAAVVALLTGRRCRSDRLELLKRVVKSACQFCEGFRVKPVTFASTLRNLPVRVANTNARWRPKQNLISLCTLHIFCTYL